MTYDLFYENYLNYNRDVRIAVGQEIDIDTNTKPVPPVPPTPEPKNAICLTNIDGTKATIWLDKISSHQTIEYSVNGETWEELEEGQQITISKCYFRGKLTGDNRDEPDQNIQDYTQFNIATGQFKVTGNLNGLWNYEDLDQPLYAYCATHLFDGCKGVYDISELQLPSTTLSGKCYAFTFQGCSISALPELPATTLAWACYWYTFSNCTNLLSIPENYLPLTDIASFCYGYMFNGCVNLATVPSNLLPATTLQQSCYIGMFCNCSKLRVAPELPAETLVTTCYQAMFYCDASSGGSQLENVKCLATNINSETTNATLDWLYTDPRIVGITKTLTKSADVTESDWRTYGNVPDYWEIV